MKTPKKSSLENRNPKTISREKLLRAKEKGLFYFRTLREERNRVQIDRLQRKQFGDWSDVFSSLEKCSGRVMICLLGKTVVGYQSFTPFSTQGNPFPEDREVMRFTYVTVKDDNVLKARGLGIATELLKRTLELAWSWDYEAVYSYTVAYELLEKVGFVCMGGEEIVKEARYVRDFEPEMAPPLLYFIERSKIVKS